MLAQLLVLMRSLLLAITMIMVSAPTLKAEGLDNGTCGDAPVKMADLSWESAAFITQLIKHILEQGYGCNVEVVPGTSAALETALAEDDIQIIAELWSGRTEIIEKALAENKIRVVGDLLEGGAEQGWYVPDYMIDGDANRNINAITPELRSVEDLKKYADVFSDPEDPTKGRFFNCPTGWVCEQFNTELLAVYGLDQHYVNFRSGTGAALDSAITAAYERGKPILFYYWQPAGLMAKYSFRRIEQPPFNEACWEAAVNEQGKACPTDFIVSHLSVGLSTPFAQIHPALLPFFERIELRPGLVNATILKMNEQQLSGADAALSFLREYPQDWKTWVPSHVALRLEASLTPASVESGVDTSGDRYSIFPSWSLRDRINDELRGVVRHSGDTFRSVSNVLLLHVLLPLERFLMATPPTVFLLFIAVLSWHATRRLTAAVLYTAGFYLIGALGLWDKLMQTLALVLVATGLSIIIGIPIGILSARNRWLRRLIAPVLDVMQTMPSFVYLIPVLMLFGLGKVPAIFATIIYAVPPLIRLTSLGIRQVDHELVEAAQSFGVTRTQMLYKVTLPLARPSIMAGINQTTMLALSMVVVASMIGAQGLGEDVLAGIQTNDIGRGLQAGLAIVILAIVMDRTSQAYGRSRRARARLVKMERKS